MSEGRSVGVVVEDFRPLQKNTLRGFVRARLQSGMIIGDVAIHVGGDNKTWAAPPSKPLIDREGQVLRDADGKVRYVPLITFASRELRDRFSEAVLDALRAAHPDALTTPSGREDAA